MRADISILSPFNPTSTQTLEIGAQIGRGPKFDIEIVSKWWKMQQNFVLRWLRGVECCRHETGLLMRWASKRQFHTTVAGYGTIFALTLYWEAFGSHMWTFSWPNVQSRNSLGISYHIVHTIVTNTPKHSRCEYICIVFGRSKICPKHRYFLAYVQQFVGWLFLVRRSFLISNKTTNFWTVKEWGSLNFRS